jgi:hypothetical protein
MSAAMSKHRYLAHLTEIATESALVKKTSVDTALTMRAFLPRRCLNGSNG